MSIKILYDYMDKKSNKVKKITGRLYRKNPDYEYKEIKNMVLTALFECETIPTDKQIYLTVLNRILEEKGYKYRENSLIKLTVNVKDEILENNSHNLEEINAPELLNQIFCKAALSQDEVFVTAIVNGLSSPKCLTGKLKEMLDDMPLIYYIRPLTKKEIASIMGVKMAQVDTLWKTAIKKIKRSLCT